MKDFFVFPVCLLFFVTFQLHSQTSDKICFDFGSVAEGEGDMINMSNASFSLKGEVEAGFDFGTAENVRFEKSAFTANLPVYFSINLPEGNYKVTLVLGSDEKNSITTVKAESRRLMLDQVPVNKGDSTTKILMVNVRAVNIINSRKDILIKSREEDDLNWDKKLTLEFLGETAVRSLAVEKVENLTTLYLAGDSTVTDQDLEPWASWGQMIPQYFTEDVVVSNYAASGLSLGSFKSGRRLEKILSSMKPGDYLFIEFGHNDQKEKGEGKGPWQSYTNSLIEFIEKTREKGGIPVLLTPAQRRHFTADGELKDTHGDYPNAMRKVAKDHEVALIDITEMTSEMYKAWGTNLSKKAFVHYPPNTFPGQDIQLQDDTHFNSFGANELALAVLQGIRDSNLKLKDHILTETPSYNPSKPNEPSHWTVPVSSRFENTKPEGN